MTDSPPPEREPKRMPPWAIGLLVMLAVIVVLGGVCVPLVMG
ncbi:MAG TPA: hypothetical protein VLG28_01035 [Acidimicrobiia bacterium]|jgi:hypothetical protein|nr:hypothetical protein [Acidimicrobiia bacterium]